MPTALVVDDASGPRNRVATLLRLGGWEVHEAVGAEVTLTLAERHQPDLVVTDIVLPDGSGADLLLRLRQEGSRAYFVVLAAQPTDLVRQCAAAAGAVACLAKPVDPREFLDLMQGVSRGLALERARATRPVRGPAPLRVDARRIDDAERPPQAQPRDRVRETYVHGLPSRLSAIAAGAREGNPAAVAFAARTLAGASAAAAQAEVASVCSTIAAEADRGVVVRARLLHLVALSASVRGGRPDRAERAERATQFA